MGGEDDAVFLDAVSAFPAAEQDARRKKLLVLVNVLPSAQNK